MLIDTLSHRWRDRDDFHVSGNMFIYYSSRQARNYYSSRQARNYYSSRQARNRDCCGPDFFVVLGASRQPPRLYWTVWEEVGRYPDLIIELTSPTTADEDRTFKKDLYARTFRIREYIIYDLTTHHADA